MMSEELGVFVVRQWMMSEVLGVFAVRQWMLSDELGVFVVCQGRSTPDPRHSAHSVRGRVACFHPAMGHSVPSSGRGANSARPVSCLTPCCRHVPDGPWALRQHLASCDVIVPFGVLLLSYVNGR